MPKAFEIEYDQYCFECTGGVPETGSAGAPVTFTLATDSGTTGNAALSGVQLISSDGQSVGGTVSGTDATFSVTFPNAGTYTLNFLASYTGTPGLSQCGPYTIVIS